MNNEKELVRYFGYRGGIEGVSLYASKIFHYGAYVTSLPEKKGIRIGNRVSNTEKEPRGLRLYYPFTASQFRHALRIMAERADRLYEDVRRTHEEKDQ